MSSYPFSRRVIRKLTLSPYDWCYTIQLPFYFLFPGHRNYPHLKRLPTKQQVLEKDTVTTKLIFVGDIMQLPHNKVPKLSNQFLQLVSRADFFIANCEGPVVEGSDQNQTNFFSFSIPIGYIKGILDQAGLPGEQCVINVANNHSKDEPEPVFMNGLALLRDKLGVNLVGYNDIPPYISLKTKSDMNLMIASWTTLMNSELFFKTPKTVWRHEDIEAMDWFKQKKTSKNNFLIGLPHWDREYQHFPSQQTCDSAHKLTNNGFDLLVGSHPHVLQPFEWINNKLCCYSMGNFCSVDYQYETKLSSVLELDISMETKGIAAYHLHFFAQIETGNEILIQPLDELEADLKKKYRELIRLMFVLE